LPPPFHDAEGFPHKTCRVAFGGPHKYRLNGRFDPIRAAGRKPIDDALAVPCGRSGRLRE